jgi:hypothetical protein
MPFASEVGPGLCPANFSRHEAATALPKAGAVAEGLERPTAQSAPKFLSSPRAVKKSRKQFKPKALFHLSKAPINYPRLAIV